MPKKTVRASVNAPTQDPAAALIAKASTTTRVDLSDEARAALQKVLAHNDSRSRSGPGRVSLTAAVEMLRTHYGWGGGTCALETLCVRVLGRRSWGTP